MNMKITPILVCAPLSVISFLIYRYYCVHWTPLEIFAICAFIFDIGILVLIDRFLVLWINKKVLCFIEAFVIIILILLKAWDNILLWPIMYV